MPMDEDVTGAAEETRRRKLIPQCGLPSIYSVAYKDMLRSTACYGHHW